ncbi:MAG: RNA pseudouridine synthase, partial [Actinobacteria bacterium]|nr:RNA pseudouridine synthase [Actinomycetota bacterium]NIV58668.1 RNA pseudouridine synthase [Actinomycetota bacterium]NIX53464.1 RNA pseudouridine synthase [Actinomycetota bacterium]
MHEAGRTLAPAERLAAGTVLTASLPDPAPALVPSAVEFDVVYQDDAV